MFKVKRNIMINVKDNNRMADIARGLGLTEAYHMGGEARRISEPKMFYDPGDFEEYIWYEIHGTGRQFRKFFEQIKRERLDYSIMGGKR